MTQVEALSLFKAKAQNCFDEAEGCAFFSFPYAERITNESRYCAVISVESSEQRKASLGEDICSRALEISCTLYSPQIFGGEKAEEKTEKLFNSLSSLDFVTSSKRGKLHWDKATLCLVCELSFVCRGYSENGGDFFGGN